MKGLTHLACIALLLLNSDLHTTYVHGFRSSTHKCLAGDDNARICTFRNLILYRGRFLYLSESSTKIPSIPCYRPGPWKVKRIKVEVVTPAELQDVIKPAANMTTTTLPQAALVYRMHADNWGHHMLDVTPTLHRVMCSSSLRLCTYNKEDQHKTWLVFYDRRPLHKGGFQRIWGCYSGNQPIYANNAHDSHYDKVVVIENAVVGWTWASLIYDRNWNADMAGSLYRRLWKCVGLDPRHTIAGVPQTRVTIVQRAFAESDKARSFVNAAEVVAQMRLKHPKVEWQVVVLDHLTFDEIVQVFHSSSIVLHVNGAAMGNMMFMRKGAVFVDMAPSQWYFDMVPAVEANMKAHLQVSTLTYSKWKPAHNPIRWELAAASPRFAGLKKEDMLRMLREHDCPAAIAAHCKGHVIYTQGDFVLTPGLMQRIFSEGLKLMGKPRSTIP